MGRIEDNEAERAERLRQERKLQEQQLKTKQIAENQQFQHYVAKAQDAKKQDARGDQQRSEQNKEAGRMLLARRGLGANHTSQSLATKGAESNARTRELARQSERARNQLQQTLGNPDPLAARKESGRSDAMGVGRGASGEGSEQGGQHGQRGQSKEVGANAAPAPTTSYAAIGQAAVQALDGLGARASGRSVSAADQAEKVRAMIEAIVKGVRQGCDEQGFGLIEVTLNDDVLGGSRLTVLNSQSGIHLKVDTGEHGHSQTERPNEALLKASAHELSAAMAAAKVQLVGLEINGEKVLA